MEKAPAPPSEFSLYRARTLRQCAERYLEGQERSFAATEARATNLLGWNAAGIVGLAVQMIVARFNPAILVAEGCLLVSALAACAVLWPAKWEHSGQRPIDIQSWVDETEIDFESGLAGSYQAAIEENRKTMRRASRLMRIAWKALFAAPLLALLLAAIISV